MREIKLNNDRVALVDDEDFEELSKYTWTANWAKHVNGFYANRSFTAEKRVRKKVSMHRQIMKVTNSKIKVDHKNRNTLDNRKENLRICTTNQNGQNQKLHSDSTTGFKGVYKRKGRPSGKKIWYSSIQVKGKRIFLGLHFTPEQAAIAYDIAAIKYFGEFALVNFPKREAA